MSFRQLLRKRLTIPNSKRFQSTSPRRRPPPPPSGASTAPAASKTTTRFNAILSRVPKPLQKYTDPLRDAPTTTVVAFLALHEITAVVPLVGFAGLFHWTGWIPSGFTDNAYMEKYARYFRRKNWFGFSEEQQDQQQTLMQMENGQSVWLSEGGGRILVEVAAAYAITKLLLPMRILGCVWATPRVVGVLGRWRKTS
ncbi:hypothetical protein PVAG01_04838 [Phlyctema vagabunda]|uniref:DUF1279 domain-containing protein n=1 Tax=Phlyctema vagabunda TaxID=108571 RepID=A0ABR4PIC2_9HELO